MSYAHDIEIISAPSILGLKPTGVQEAGQHLLRAGLAEYLPSPHPVVHVHAHNELYSATRDQATNCINTEPVREFSIRLCQAIDQSIEKKRFAFVLGGDCSILLGIMPALRKKGRYGLIFFDAHADFYEPEKSTTGEVSDMDLGIITGHEPDRLSDINGVKPYVEEMHVVHIGQRDEEETMRYGARNIRQTAVRCLNLEEIKTAGVKKIASEIIDHVQKLRLDGFWIHYDTDVLSDDINPAVDYRLPGGLEFEEMEYLLKELLKNCTIAGISVTIFNPRLDKDGSIAENITQSLGRAFKTD